MLYNIVNLAHRRKDNDKYQICVSNLSIYDGEKIAITGPSGCGKSTLLDILGMSIRPLSVDVFEFKPNKKTYDVKTLWRRSSLDKMAWLREMHMGYILQTGELLPFYTTEENILTSAILHGMDIDEARLRVNCLLERLEIAHLRNILPNRLSVGERQRVAIGRALAPHPNVILADEPTAAIDPKMAERIMQIFIDAIEEYGTTVILVSHDINLAKHFGFNIYPITIKTAEDGVGVKASLNIH